MASPTKKEDVSTKTEEKKETAAGTATLQPYPDMSLAQDLFLAGLAATSSANAYTLDATKGAKDRLLKGIKENLMVPYYEHVCSVLGLQQDATVLSDLKKQSDDKLALLAEKLKDAQENHGETEVADALHAQAAFLAQMGHKEKAIEAYLTAQEKTAGLGGKIDVLLNIVRIGFLYSDNEICSTYLEKAEAMIAKGGDWDRRNRFKVYQGTFAMSKRDFKTAASLLLDALSTFTCTELMSYNTFVQYAVLSGALALERAQIKAKVMDAPEVLEVIHEMPYLESLIAALYNCQYGTLFTSLAELEVHLKHDRYTHPHYRFYVREMRIKAYAQLLEAYRSVTLASMAKAFGVTVDFIDTDLSRFIASHRLHAVIDKVEGIVETNRPDAKNAQYQQVIKLGDVLISKIQKLSKVITI